jgi:Flp pilus assembly pilin Flp
MALRRLEYFSAHSVRRTQEEKMIRLVTYLDSLRKRNQNDEGQDLLEYALLVALIAIVAVGAVTLAGQKVDAIFKEIVAVLPS